MQNPFLRLRLPENFWRFYRIYLGEKVLLLECRFTFRKWIKTRAEHMGKPMFDSRGSPLVETLAIIGC